MDVLREEVTEVIFNGHIGNVFDSSAAFKRFMESLHASSPLGAPIMAYVSRKTYMAEKEKKYSTTFALKG